MALDDPVTARIVAFIEQVGIPVETDSIPEGSFLPAITIRNGAVVYDPARLEWPGDLLHEAGHVAVTPPEKRSALSEIRSDPAEEMSAIGWSYAAALAIGLDPTVVFHDNGYVGGSTSLLENFAEGRFLAVPMLQYYGMTLEPRPAAERGEQPYPHMTSWLRTRPNDP
ncbi:hypothetical protein U1769_15075 [Sphingomonas sp. ZT3P38]|uniref:hypothetical protein n=1 Tax=Parasphingomonas zepuensis TaxID=3096161 RepID=UPI002FC8E7CF